MKYVLVQKTITKITEECNTYEIYSSDDALDVLEELKQNLDIHKSWGEIVSMTDNKTFMSETCEKIYFYSIEVKKEPEIKKWG